MGHFAFSLGTLVIWSVSFGAGLFPQRGTLGLLPGGWYSVN